MFCRRAVWVFALTIVIAGLCFLSIGRLGAQQESAVVGTEFGDPVQGITAREFELFRLGLEDFTEVENPDEFGPVFTGRSCAECHSVPRVAGLAPSRKFAPN
jgi:hypothetical protein